MVIYNYIGNVKKLSIYYIYANICVVSLCGQCNFGFFLFSKKKKEKKKAINYCLDPFFYEMVIRGSRNLPKIVTLL